MNNLVVGEKYYLTDHSYSTEIVDGKLSIGRGWLRVGYHDIVEVIAHGDLVLPTDLYSWSNNTVLNNTVVRRIADGRIIFTHDRFIKDLSKQGYVDMPLSDYYWAYNEIDYPDR